MSKVVTLFVVLVMNIDSPLATAQPLEKYQPANGFYIQSRKIGSCTAGPMTVGDIAP